MPIASFVLIAGLLLAGTLPNRAQQSPPGFFISDQLSLADKAEMLDVMNRLDPNERDNVILLTHDGRLISNRTDEALNWTISPGPDPALQRPDPCYKYWLLGNQIPPPCVGLTGGATGGLSGGSATGGLTGLSSSGGSTGVITGGLSAGTSGTGGTIGGSSVGATGTTGGLTAGTTGSTGDCKMPLAASAASKACTACIGEYEPEEINPDHSHNNGPFRRIRTPRPTGPSSSFWFVGGTAGLPDPTTFTIKRNSPGVKGWDGPHVYFTLTAQDGGYSASVEGGFKDDGEGGKNDPLNPNMVWKPYMAIKGTGPPIQIQPKPALGFREINGAQAIPCYLTTARGLIKFVLEYPHVANGVFTLVGEISRTASPPFNCLNAFNPGHGTCQAARTFTIAQARENFATGSQVCGLSWSNLRVSQTVPTSGFPPLSNFGYGDVFDRSKVGEASNMPYFSAQFFDKEKICITDPETLRAGDPVGDWTHETVNIKLQNPWWVKP